MLSDEELIFINKIVQSIVPLEEGVDWFQSASEDKQLEILRGLYNFSIQAGDWDGDADEAIKKSKLKPTYTPCVLLRKGRLSAQLTKIVNLPTNERLKSFKLLLALFEIADSSTPLLPKHSSAR